MELKRSLSSFGCAHLKAYSFVDFEIFKSVANFLFSLKTRFELGGGECIPSIPAVAEAV